MIQESEIIRLILGVAGACMLVISGRGLQRLPGNRVFVAAYHALLSGWIFTVFEHVAIYEVLNILEHAAYVVSGVLYILWCYLLFGKAAKH